MKSVMLLGHRGSPNIARENTLESFQAAMDAGLDGVELDVQRSLDGVLVVHHDFHLPDGRLIAALKASEVEAAILPMNGRVPRLADVLEWAKSANAFVNVEIKSHGLQSDNRELETVKCIAATGMRSNVIVSSFNPASLARVRFADSGLETGLLFENNTQPKWLLENGWSAALLGVKALHPYHANVTPELMRRAKRRGWKVNTWTVNDLEIAQDMIALGVNALIGNFPEVLLEAAGRTAKTHNSSQQNPS
jgi:glycerophosphoryl diester phosphodiesterase